MGTALFYVTQHAACNEGVNRGVNSRLTDVPHEQLPVVGLGREHAALAARIFGYFLAASESRCPLGRG